MVIISRLKHAFRRALYHLACHDLRRLYHLLSNYGLDWLVPSLSPIVPLQDRLPYRYHGLESPTHIRVLELLPPSNPEDVLCFKVHHADLNAQTVSYTAISHVWGDRTVPQDRLVECDGLRAYVPPGLHSALRRIRARASASGDSAGASQFIWADALSIDQADSDAGRSEKALQVRMMDRIFGRAEEVVIYLGELDDGDLPHLSTLDRYQAIPDEVWDRVNMRDVQSSIGDSVALLPGLDLPTSDSPFWPFLQRFIGRPWFTRVWIIQEYALSRAPKFMIGDHLRDVDFLPAGIARAAQHLGVLYLHDRFYSPTLQLDGLIGDAFWYVLRKHHAIHRIYSARSQAGFGRSLCELLDATTNFFDATDARDKVYALLGLSSDDNVKEDLPVDYEEEERELALRVSQYLSRRGFGIYPLYHCVGVRNDRSVSWALNLTSPGEGLGDLIGPSGHTSGRVFDACGEALFVRKSADLPLGKYTVRGWIVDELSATAMTDSLPYDTELKHPRDIEAYAVWQGRALRWMLDVAATQPVPPADFTKICWRTVVADLVMATGREGHGYRRLRDWLHGARCIDTVDAVVRLAYDKWTGALPPEHTVPLDPVQLSHMRVYGESMAHALGRKLALTRQNRLPCMAPSHATTGDLVVVIQGCEIPFILRRRTGPGPGPGTGTSTTSTPDVQGCSPHDHDHDQHQHQHQHQHLGGRQEPTETFRIVGCAYVHGIMDGETVEGADVRDLEIC
ncbi:hypothetical protein A1O3_01696 [Capronia epimyces CBS 606.96]|uniref:Heterokaryon incompatibility domain-containing protein n=1 Tax=Capronia epimyces CBS 606.96 TaxID=1182542 RepID=W9ZF56_9EURO|nr:uncharacterized protein A1O3_01696 [Capronia epimyces CBS 606.96]EXJ93139.1 hypothetical protein A1O3_01696 [Capronia epimyces CBS 606.96]